MFLGILISQLSTCSIPNLYFDFLSVDLDSPELEINSDGGQQVVVELVIHKPSEYGGFPH